MKLISWNVNGLRACIGKGFLDFFNAADADIFCLQETKLQPHQISLDLPGYQKFWCSAEKKGYSGTAVFTKHKPLTVRYELPDTDLGGEGRVITLEFDRFFLVCCYTPNSQDGLKRLNHRMIWDAAFRNYLKYLCLQKPVIACGDMNVAHQEIDLKNPAANHKNPGFSDAERNSFSELLNSGFADTFRTMYPSAIDAYSWWSYRMHAREKNIGWRIDYFIVSNCLLPAVEDAAIFSSIPGSDHCPVGLTINEAAMGINSISEEK